jgi:hypothetical protein
MAFLSFVKSRGERYVYITEYCGNKEYSSSKKKHVFSLGKQEDALYTLQAWKLNYDFFPKELKDRGYNKKDIKKWIQDIKRKP